MFLIFFRQLYTEKLDFITVFHFHSIRLSKREVSYEKRVCTRVLNTRTIYFYYNVYICTDGLRHLISSIFLYVGIYEYTIGKILSINLFYLDNHICGSRLYAVHLIAVFLRYFFCSFIFY